jgi:hypothetical protein
VSVVTSVSAAAGADVAIVFRWVFLAALVFLVLSLAALVMMEERLLRATPASVAPDPAPSPQPAE